MFEMPPRYNPKETDEKIGLLSEDELYAFWEKKGYFHGAVTPGKPRFSLVIPPPNITGILTMGHVMDNTPQDIMVRYNRMRGNVTTWIPGTDHAGIATQNMVEKELAKTGVKKQDLGREEFVKTCWAWRDQYGNRIIRQLKSLGCSCDWERVKFTMDPDLSSAVREAFVRLYRENLIYQGEYLINWCPRCLTALSDEEVEHKEITGGLYWIKYPIKGAADEHIVVATTRPETMLGDTAVAVNPDDPRYAGFKGKKVVLPLIGREIEIITDPRVDTKFGSGAVKVTPAHDPNDFMMAKDHNLKFINILEKDAKLNAEAGPYAGMDRFKAREKVLADLEAQGLLVKQDQHRHAVGHCYRCNTVVEPFISKQWFVRMTPLAEPAIRAVKESNIVFVPDRWTKIYLDWMENIRDWCISRQLWWGHRIPVWYCKKCGKTTVDTVDPTKCHHCGSPEIEQDPDVLDTWFSSWLWPFSTLGWPNETPDLGYFYPTNVLNSGKDIIFFWVARMIMAGHFFTGKRPFGHVYFHGIARDSQGRKMSKSLGNSPDPIAVMDIYGADAVRFGIMSNIPMGEDVKLSDKVYELGRNFVTKLWNATRFFLTNAGDPAKLAGPIDPDKLTLEDRWILSRLQSAVIFCTEYIDSYQFSEAAKTVSDFFWHDLCDWYIEMVKSRLRGEAGEESAESARKVLYHCMTETYKLLHPFAPFVSDKLWMMMRKMEGPSSTKEESIMISKWPVPTVQLRDIELEMEFDVLIRMVSGVRDVRARMDISKNQPLEAIVSAPDAGALDSLRRHDETFRKMALLDKAAYEVGAPKPPKSASCIVDAYRLFVPVGGLIDVESERKKLGSALEKTLAMLESTKKKLSNEDFMRRAPEDIVELEKQKLAENESRIAAIKDSLKDLEA